MPKFLLSLLLAVSLLLLSALGASFIAEAPYPAERVFNQLKLGQLWSERARYLDEWYAVEAIDEGTFIIGEPRSSQYNSSYLIVGQQRALLIDAGSGERAAHVRSMRAIAESLTGKPVTLALSHFHFDHLGDLDAFDGVVLVESAELRQRSAAHGGMLRARDAEVLTGERSFKVRQWIASGDAIDLGGRRIEMRATPGHAPHAATFIDRERRYVLTGDFLYQHLGGLVAFLPGSDVATYADQIDSLLQATGAGYRYFGAHGLQEFDLAWATRVQGAMRALAAGTATTRLAESYLAPHMPLRLHRDDQLLVYLPPLVQADTLYSSRFLAALLAAIGVISALFWQLFRRWSHSKAGV